MREQSTPPLTKIHFILYALYSFAIAEIFNLGSDTSLLC